MTDAGADLGILGLTFSHKKSAVKRGKIFVEKEIRQKM
jgi:hypothetical protein